MKADNRIYCKNCNIVFSRQGDDGHFELKDHKRHDLTVVEMNRLIEDDVKDA